MSADPNAAPRTLTWRRFVLDEDDDEDERFVELARDGAAVHLRRGRAGREPAEELKRLASEAAAARSVEKRAATLLAQGYLEDDPVVRPALDPAPRPAELRAQQAAEGRAAFDARLPAFVAAWRELGFDPSTSFAAQCRRTRLHPNEVAERCLECVAATLGVAFTRRTRSYDVEHGAVQRVPARLVAEFYQGPAQVLALAYARLQGRGGGIDDDDTPGLVDEIAARLRALDA